MSNLIRELDEQRVLLEATMRRSQESRATLLRALEDASDASIFEHTSEAKTRLISVVEEDVCDVDSKIEEEVKVSLVSAAVELGKAEGVFEIRSRLVVSDRAVVLVSRGAGLIGQGQLDFVCGSTDIMIPAGGSVTDALLYVSELNTCRIRVFNVSTGVFVRDIVGDGGLGIRLRDVLMSSTGPQGTSEMYVSDHSNHCIAVMGPMTGGHIRNIGRGHGAGISNIIQVNN